MGVAPVVATAVGEAVELPRPFVHPIPTTKTFEAAIEQIVEGIEAARLRKGDRLPHEAELAGQLDISKPTLRQALRVLERAGLIAVRRGARGGIFVDSDLVPTEVISSYVALEVDAVVDVLRGRRVLEFAITRVAVNTATHQDHLEIQRAVDLLNKHLNHRARALRADMMFHRTIARATHNDTLQTAYRGVSRQLLPILDAVPTNTETNELTLDIHARQMHAMRRKDHSALDEVLDQHLRQLEDAFVSSLGRARDDVFDETKW